MPTKISTAPKSDGSPEDDLFSSPVQETNGSKPPPGASLPALGSARSGAAADPTTSYNNATRGTVKSKVSEQDISSILDTMPYSFHTSHREIFDWNQLNLRFGRDWVLQLPALLPSLEASDMQHEKIHSKPKSAISKTSKCKTVARKPSQPEHNKNKVEFKKPLASKFRSPLKPYLPHRYMQPPAPVLRSAIHNSFTRQALQVVYSRD